MEAAVTVENGTATSAGRAPSPAASARWATRSRRSDAPTASTTRRRPSTTAQADEDVGLRLARQLSVALTRKHRASASAATARRGRPADRRVSVVDVAGYASSGVRSADELRLQLGRHRLADRNADVVRGDAPRSGSASRTSCTARDDASPARPPRPTTHRRGTAASSPRTCRTSRSFHSVEYVDRAVPPRRRDSSSGYACRGANATSRSPSGCRGSAPRRRRRTRRCRRARSRRGSRAAPRRVHRRSSPG